jgi:hypothetical protein
LYAAFTGDRSITRWREIQVRAFFTEIQPVAIAKPDLERAFIFRGNLTCAKDSMGQTLLMPHWFRRVWADRSFAFQLNALAFSVSQTHGG